ncbi:unnamed protein product [Hydatigera taeniaeformis]|uniref:DPPIV_N domain-containing protein n=1 Tax=Hydatigena taeniaeformis TaxID=6205 RepID=A0A0R3WU93_HYDTA|nr:unnamed protein product [Hydatigera taeniaeformis]
MHVVIAPQTEDDQELRCVHWPWNFTLREGPLWIYAAAAASEDGVVIGEEDDVGFVWTTQSSSSLDVVQQFQRQAVVGVLVVANRKVVMVAHFLTEHSPCGGWVL